MIGATVAMAGMALLFVVFGVFALGGSDCDGHCAGCTGANCEFDKSGSES